MIEVEIVIIITSALPVGFLPDSHPHKLMIAYSMKKMLPNSLFISMPSLDAHIIAAHNRSINAGGDVEQADGQIKIIVLILVLTALI